MQKRRKKTSLRTGIILAVTLFPHVLQITDAKGLRLRKVGALCRPVLSPASHDPDFSAICEV
jgi:hypothetical protein